MIIIVSSMAFLFYIFHIEYQFRLNKPYRNKSVWFNDVVQLPVPTFKL